ncbi:Odorant receptor Or1 [Eumeta japonica]|uniref:Odorant receptor Or1 n=1 Tax=Eumeta variegata TaxID=151549 RepID=A0A4C1VCU1_EUMVA|nr:Odorant receptor Or1 [Eumeta japonica]
MCVKRQLGACVRRHRAALAAARALQACFSAPTFAQFAVSLVIICVTAFQLASQTSNPLRLLAMGTYLLNMSFQVFIYCYSGHALAEQVMCRSDDRNNTQWRLPGGEPLLCVQSHEIRHLQLITDVSLERE